MCTMVTVCLALVAAVIFGAASILEQRSTKQVPDRAALSPRLLTDLLKRPQFLTALTLTIVGSALQILALHAGSPALVQPLLVLSLLFAVVIAAATRRRPPDRVVLGGAITCMAGIACFLAVARPHGGSSDVSSVAWLPLATALAAVLAGCLAAVRWGPAGIRSLWLALACGVDFGVNAFLLKVVPDTLPLGFADPLRQWPLFMIVIVTPAGFLLNQNAFQAGTLISPVLALIYTADPLTSITVSIMFLHERIAASPPALAGEAAALAVMTSGIIALAHRAPTCAGRLPLQPRPGPATAPEVPAAHTHRGTNPEPRSAPDAQSAPSRVSAAITGRLPVSPASDTKPWAGFAKQIGEHFNSSRPALKRGTRHGSGLSGDPAPSRTCISTPYVDPDTVEPRPPSAWLTGRGPREQR